MERKLLAGSQAALPLKVYIDFQMLMNLAASGKILDTRSWQSETAQFPQQWMFALPAMYFSLE